MTWMELPGADWAEGLLYAEGSLQMKNWKDKIWDSTIKYIKQNRANIDVFLTYLYPKQIDSNAIADIKQLGIPCINFYCDHVREFNTVPLSFQVFDLLWVPEYEAIAMYKKCKMNFIHLPMPMWVDHSFRHIAPTQESFPVSFLGTKDILRANLLAEAIDKGLEIDIWGAGWQDNSPAISSAQSITSKFGNQYNFIKARGFYAYLIKILQKLKPLKSQPIETAFFKGIPNFEQYIAITRQSQVVIGINRVPTYKKLHTDPVIYSRLRDIEAPMLGACYLTEYCMGVEHLFDIGHEIEVYRTAEEMTLRANELLKNEQKRRQLRLNAQRHALGELSIPASLTKLKTAIYG